jgi:SAM-dependent methyltransferase
VPTYPRRSLGDPRRSLGDRRRALVSHCDRRRAESFGADAARYDRSRPGYPAALIDELMSAAPRTVLDVGCGTGKAGRPFLQRGCRVLGVEPDPRMAAVARAHGLKVEIARFEEWEPAGRSFDLLVSGQAWHWVDPEAGALIAGSALRSGGWLAVFWNSLTHSPQVRAVLEAAYLAHAPELISNNIALGTNPGPGSAISDQDTDAIARTGQFEAPERLRYVWVRTYTPEQWLDELPTHSNHNGLSADRLTALLDASASGLAQVGTAFTVRYETSATVARRR